MANDPVTPDSAILDHLRRQTGVYGLTARDITELRESGVSDRVIDYMLASREQVFRGYRPTSFLRGHSHHGHHGFGHGAGTVMLGVASEAAVKIQAAPLRWP